MIQKQLQIKKSNSAAQNQSLFSKLPWQNLWRYQSEFQYFGGTSLKISLCYPIFRLVLREEPDPHHLPSPFFHLISTVPSHRNSPSAGGRIARFLNSIFNSRTVKRMKLDEAMENLSPMRKSRSVKDSATYSSSTVSSFSRSCLSTKSSGSEGLKRSVRLCPVSIIVDEDCRPCGQKSIYKDDPSLMRNLKNAQRERFRDYQVKRNSTWSRYEFREFQPPLNDDAEEEEVESCCSSDLFELENIGAYREELPVYGTTNLKTNYAIANGIIL